VLAFPDGAGGWVNDAGDTVEVTSRPGRATTMLLHEGTPAAAIEHDEALLARTEALDAAAAVAAVAIDNARLRALTLARVEEARAGGERLLAAAERARVDLAREVATGPDPLLAEAQDALGVPRPALNQAADLLLRAVAAIRTISRGTVPSALADRGLAAALEDLVGRAASPVRILGVPAGRFPAPIETTAFLIVAECAARAAHPIEVRIVPGEAALHVDVAGAKRPLPQLVVDRIITLDGDVSHDAEEMRVTLPLPVPARRP